MENGIKVEVTQEWHEDYNEPGKWNNPWGWETEIESVIDKEVFVTDADKHGHPTKGYYIENGK